ncbi:hypothetical protein BDR22DRAFT_973101 [Usnea florida]
MAPPNETNLAEQHSNDQSPTTPPTLMIPMIPSSDPARKNQIQAEKKVEILTPTTHATGTEDHHSERVQGRPNQVEASTTAMDIPVGGINPQQQFASGAATVAPLQSIITTAENHGADYGHDEGQYDSISDDGGDEQKSGPGSGDDDGNEDDENEHSDSDSGDTGGGGESGSDSGDADDEKQSGSDSGDGDDEDEEQSDSDDGEEEENEEEEAEEVKEEENKDVDDETIVTPPGVNTNNRGNNSLITPASIEINHRDTERSDLGMPRLIYGSSEEDNDGPNNRSPATATARGLENGDGKSSDGVAIAEAASVLMTMRQRAGGTMEDSRTPSTPASTASDQGNVNSGQTQRVTPVVPEQAADENHDAVSSDVASEEDAPASNQEDEDMNSDFEEDEVSGTLGLRGGAGEPDVEGSHSEEEIEPTDSDSHLLPAEVPETPPRTPNSARETAEPAVTPTQDMEGAASESDTEAYPDDGEETRLTGSERRLLPAEIPETPPRTIDRRREAQGSGVTPIQDMEEAASEPDMEASHHEEEIELTGSDGRFHPAENPETPSQLRGRHGEDHNDSDHDEEGPASSPEIPGSFFPRYQRAEVDREDTQEPADISEQDFNDDTSEDDWEADCTEADPFEFRDEMPESPVRPTHRLGDDLADFDLDEGEEVPSTEDRVARITGYHRPGSYDEYDRTYGYQRGESSIDRTQSKGKSKEMSPNEPSSSNNAIENPDSKDEENIHLRVQYLVARSKRSKASMCLWIPTDISYPVLTRTIINALQQHNGTPNPNPAHPNAVIARLLLFIAGRTRPIELTSSNLQQNLALVPQRSVYDYVKVEFVPGTNGEMRRRKGTGKVNGRCGKVGGL